MKVHMHCARCEQDLRRMLLRHKGEKTSSNYNTINLKSLFSLEESKKQTNIEQTSTQ